MTLRAATSDDAGLLARLRYDFRASFGTIEEPAGQFLPRCENWIAERLHPEGTWRAWIADWEGTTAGTIWLQLIEKIPNPVAEPEWHGYITNLYVRDQFRGRQLGSALLAAALNACTGKGVDAVILWPTPMSRTLYARHGFTVRDDIMVWR